MSLLRNIAGGLRSLFRKEQVNEDLVEELNGLLEMAAEEPEVGLDVEFRPNHAPAMLATFFGDLADPVEHQHRRERQLSVSDTEQFAAAAGQQVFVLVATSAVRHLLFLL